MPFPIATIQTVPLRQPRFEHHFHRLRLHRSEENLDPVVLQLSIATATACNPLASIAGTLRIPE